MSEVFHVPAGLKEEFYRLMQYAGKMGSSRGGNRAQSGSRSGQYQGRGGDYGGGSRGYKGKSSS